MGPSLETYRTNGRAVRLGIESAGRYHRIEYHTPVDNRLAHLDQASFLEMRARGYGALIQFTWIYDRPIDIDGLGRFHHNLGYGLLGRRIERSPLPFARDRWVLSRAPEDIDIARTPRRRADVSAWADERARLPVDPELGPSWHLGVLPLEDNGTAISLVASHTLSDAAGMIVAVVDASKGRTRNLGYPPPGSRTRRRAMFDDGRQTLASAPEVARALVAAARLVRHNRQDLASSIETAPRSPRVAGDDQAVMLPSVTVYIDLEEWDARAKSLGGTSNSLFAGFASRLGVRVGHVSDDGAVTLSFPVSQRTEDDSRGNALTFAVVRVDPTHAARDLGEIRVKIKQALTEVAENSNEVLATLPLTSMVPKWVARRMLGMGPGAADLAIGCSNLGDVDPATNRPDGTDADYASGRLIMPDVKKSTLERIGRQLFLGSVRIHGKISITVVAYLVGRVNSRAELREMTLRTLAEFDLTAMID
jgi:hypothetical protein